MDYENVVVLKETAFKNLIFLAYIGTLTVTSAVLITGVAVYKTIKNKTREKQGL